MHKGERFNTITHLLGSIAALVGLVVLIVTTSRQGEVLPILSVTIYGTTLVLLYVFSTLNHGLRGKAKNVFQKLDFLAIYLLIAGTYTPFALITLGEVWGGSFLVLCGDSQFLVYPWNYYRIKKIESYL